MSSGTKPLGQVRVRPASMSPDRLRECLDLIGWSGQGLAKRLGKDERQVRRWASGAYGVPEPIAAWLDGLARFHASHPPPAAAGRTVVASDNA